MKTQNMVLWPSMPHNTKDKSSTDTNVKYICEPEDYTEELSQKTIKKENELKLGKKNL